MDAATTCNLHMGTYMPRSCAHMCKLCCCCIWPTPTCTDGCWCPVPLDLQQLALVVLFILATSANTACTCTCTGGLFPSSTGAYTACTYILQLACGGDGGDSAVINSLRHIASAAGSHLWPFQLGTTGCVGGASWATVAGWCQYSLHWCLQNMCKHRHKHACNSSDKSKHATCDYL